jgi:hypothetical protein
MTRAIMERLKQITPELSIGLPVGVQIELNEVHSLHDAGSERC